MARARTLKAEFFRNEVLGHMPAFARLLFAGLWTIADREGRLEDRPERIAAELFPYDRALGEADIDAFLALLDHGDLIHRYEIRGEPYIEIVKWRKHQHPHPREVSSRIPACDCKRNCKQSRGSGVAKATSGFDQGSAQDTPSRAGSIRSSGSSGSSIKPKPKEYSALPTTAREDSPNIPEVKEPEEKKPAPAEPPPQPSWAVALVPRSRAAAIALLMRSNGMRGCNAANPVVIAWADDPRVTDDLLLTAVAKAKACDATAPGPNYLAPIIDQLLNPKPARRNPDAWRRSARGIEAKASELGLYARPGESHDMLRERCESELRRRGANGHGAPA